MKSRIRIAATLLFLLCGLFPASIRAVETGATSFDQKLIEFRRQLHRHPELSNRESWTMEAIAAHLKAIGITDIRTHVAKTGVVAVIKGGKPGRMVALRAPIDAFPIQEKNNVPYRSEIPNVSHACGHDAMIAVALGAAELLFAKRDQLKGSVKFIFQPAEEGPPAGEEGGAPLMVKEGVLNGVSAIITYHVDSDTLAGDTDLTETAVYAGADRFAVAVHGKAAHGATPWKGVDSVFVAGEIVSSLQAIASRQTDIWNPVVVTVGQIEAGIRSNALAGEAKLSGTLRSFSETSRRESKESITRIAEKIADAFSAKAAVTFDDPTPPVVNNAELVKWLRPVLDQSFGVNHVRTMKPMPYADDFSYMSSRIPSVYFMIGTRNERKGITASTHTDRFDVDESTIPKAAHLAADLVIRALDWKQ